MATFWNPPLDPVLTRPSRITGTMGEWDTWVGGLTRREKGKLYPGMHTSLIAATEKITGMDEGEYPGYVAPVNAAVQKDSWGQPITPTAPTNAWGQPLTPPDPFGANPLASGIWGDPPQPESPLGILDRSLVPPNMPQRTNGFEYLNSNSLSSSAPQAMTSTNSYYGRPGDIWGRVKDSAGAVAGAVNDVATAGIEAVKGAGKTVAAYTSPPAKFVWHFYKGNGATVTLRQFGVAAAFENAPSVITAKNRLKSRFVSNYRAHRASSGDGPPFSDTSFYRTNVTWSPGTFVLGDGFITGTCRAQYGRMIVDYKYEDYFTDPWDLHEKFDIPEEMAEMGGTRYTILHSWSEEIVV